MRRVALKLPWLAWDGAGLADRLARERDILAALEHPNIARLYDAGVDARGLPYLAMEYVDGAPLDVYCNERHLGVHARIGLFLQVARAVAHAHARLIVHRDLKPSNILVTPDGTVRLLDFGVAKLIEGEAGRESAQETRLTQFAGRALTPDYAAPEHVRGEPITVAVDVYSLGVVLYELLAGERPYRIAPGPGLADALERVETRPASERVADRAWRQQLRGDLDTILAKALKKAPEERYASVDAFANDLARHLAGAPVLARPDTLAYRASRFVRRNKLAVGVCVFVVLALVGGAVPLAAVTAALAAGAGVALWQAGVARRQAARAADEARQSQGERDRVVALLERHEATSEFVQIMLAEAAQADEKVTMEELLERSEALALASVGGDPEQHAAVLDLLASVYTSFGNYAKSERLLMRAVELVRASEDVSLRAQVECNHARAIAQGGNVEIAKQTIGGWLARNDLDPRTAALCQQYLGQVAQHQNDAAGALRHAEAALARIRASHRRSPTLEASLVGDVAYANYLGGRMEEADRQFAEAMRLNADIGRAESPSALAVLNNWGLVRFFAGDVKGALSILEDVLRITAKRAANGDPPPYAVHNHAMALLALGRYDEAMLEAERTWRIAEASGAEMFKLSAQVTMASVHREQGDLASAQRILDEAEKLAAQWPADGFAVLGYRLCRAQVTLLRGDPLAALATVDPIVQLFEQRGMRISILANALRLRAEALRRCREIAGAMKDAAHALAIAQEVQGGKPHSYLTGRAWLLLAELARDAGDRARLREAAEQAVVHLSNALDAEHPQAQRARMLAAEASSEYVDTADSAR
jgi:serine/threonine-protein kinase